MNQMECSPWLYHDLTDVHPGIFNSEVVVELNAVEKAIMLAIEDLANPTTVDLSNQASSLLVDISSHYPILMLRQLPLLLRAMIHHIHRRSKSAQSQLPEEPLLSQGFGAGPLKITFSVAASKEVKASNLHITWIKCMKSINLKGLNENVDTIIRKICAREGLSP